MSAEHELLLIRFVTARTSVWITPGGGLREGESAINGLRRELAEELARTGWHIGPQVWTRATCFELERQRIAQFERYFLVPCERFAPPATMPDVRERRWFGGFRWWRLSEIESSDERFAPSRLAQALTKLLKDGPPSRPFDVGR